MIHTWTMAEIEVVVDRLGDNLDGCRVRVFVFYMCILNTIGLLYLTLPSIFQQHQPFSDWNKLVLIGCSGRRKTEVRSFGADLRLTRHSNFTLFFQ